MRKGQVIPVVQTAVIGVRGVGKGHIQNLRQHPHAVLAAVADLDEDMANQAVEGTQAKIYTDYRRMIEAVSLDAVVIATPHHLHAPMTLFALEAGLHVLVEKPIAMRVSEADRMVQTATERKRVLAVGHNYWTFPGNRTLKTLIDDGQIGPVTRVLWQWLENRPEAYYRRDIWRCTWRHAGGGVLMNQASHDVDLLCWLMGDPVEVSAMIANRAHAHEVEDTAVASIRFAGGALANVQFSTATHRLNYRQVWGERGMILFQDERNANVHAPEIFRLARYAEPLPRVIQNHPDLTGQPEITWQNVACDHASGPSLLDSFIDAIRHGGQPVADGLSARRTLELINAIVLSGVQKTTVKMPLDRAAYDTLLDDLSAGRIKIGA